ncbi:MAG: addiction module protein [Acidobacteriota bacterium]
MSLTEIESAIRKLGLKDRAALARWLVSSLDDLSDAEVEALWVEEAERRLDELERGTTTAVAAEDVLQRARAAIS